MNETSYLFFTCHEYKNRLDRMFFIKMLRKIKIKYLALYNANRDDAIRAYIKCVTTEETPETFTVIGFFLNQNENWVKEGNENCTLEILLEGLNSQTELIVDATESKISNSLVEGVFHFGQ